MTPETLAPPDMTRFTNNPNDLVALEAIIIVALCVFVIWLLKSAAKERNVMYSTLTRIEIAFTKLAGKVSTIDGTTTTQWNKNCTMNGDNYPFYGTTGGQIYDWGGNVNNTGRSNSGNVASYP